MKYIYPLTNSSETQYKVYYKHKNKRLYLGTYKNAELANKALSEAEFLLHSHVSIDEVSSYIIPFHKRICLINFRDNGVYIKNPIYIYDVYFKYFYSEDIVFLFDNKHLFFFSTNKIAMRGNYIYTQDGITQKNILSRFDIPNHSVCGKDYLFKNNNPYDFRKSNLQVINHYTGVTHTYKNGKLVYVAKIFLDKNIVIGHYNTESEAAIAYNKAIDLLKQKNIYKDKEYTPNSLPYLTQAEYMTLYDNIKISPYLLSPSLNRRFASSKKYRGICKDKSGFRASIGYKGKQIYLGIYPTEERAAQAYNFACFYLYSNTGYINDVTPLIYSKDEMYIVKHLKKHNIIKS